MTFLLKGTTRMEEKRLRDYLNAIFRAGVKVYLEGEIASPSRIASACVMEESLYMSDYVTNEKNELVEMHFHRVSRGSS